MHREGHSLHQTDETLVKCGFREYGLDLSIYSKHYIFYGHKVDSKGFDFASFDSVVRVM